MMVLLSQTTATTTMRPMPRDTTSRTFYSITLRMAMMMMIMIVTIFLPSVQSWITQLSPSTRAASTTRRRHGGGYSTTTTTRQHLAQWSGIPLYSSSSGMEDDDDMTTTTLPSASLASGTTITLDGVEIRGPITPVNNVCFVKVKDTLTATGGGILLPDQSQQRPTEGLVLAAGPGRIHPHTNILVPNPIQEGMSVLYGKFDGKPVEYKGEECQIIRDDNVLLAYTGVTLRLEAAMPIRDYVLIALFDDDDNDNDNDDDDDESSTSRSATPGKKPVTTSSGVVIAASVLKDNTPCEGRVVKIGPGRMAASGEYTKSPVQPGDYVKFKDYAGNDIFIEGKPYSVVKMVDILCTFTGEK